jgi:hypothetical protein
MRVRLLESLEVSHDQFEEYKAKVKAGEGIFYIPTAYQVTRIDKKCLLKFEKVGMECITKDKDGRGYRLVSGRKRVYIFSHQLKYMDI